MSAPRDTASRDAVAATFDALLDLDDAERTAALDALDPALRREVESLLSALERHGERLEPQRDHDLAPAAGGAAQRVGAYRLVRLVGRGGMGAVYEAERADATFVKRVAVKLIRDDVGGKEVARRFARERAILATLEHPNIARMLDGGTLDDGREYLVMEFVDGVPVTAYCARHDPTVNERLALFLQVCDAVQFAHQHLVVHGDIKPGNLLVTPDGTVKLVDFGVAKVIEEGDSLTRDPLTALGALTPAYASPEQWRGEPLSLLSDVYSLGVVLYELLARVRPFVIDSRTTADVLQVIELGARRPSDAVMNDTVMSGGAADDRTLTSARQLAHRLAGELDTIALTALESSPRRRYQSVDRLADDVRRHLDGRLVLAQPATRRYRLSKFLRRHGASVGAGAALAMAIVGGGIVATVQARHARQEKAVADHISNFLKQTLASPDASWMHAGAAGVRIADVLDAAVARADTDLRSDPAAEAMVRRTIGSAYRAVNRFADANRQLNLALAVDVKRHAPDFPDLADDYHELGWSHYLHGEWAEALRDYREAGRRCSSHDTDTSVVCYAAVADYALILATQNRLAESESLYNDVLRRGAIRFKSRDAPPLAVIYGNLANIAESRGDAHRSEMMYRLALGAWHGGPEPTERVTFFHGIAFNQLGQGRLDEVQRWVNAGVQSASNTHQEKSLATMMLWIDGAAAHRRVLDSAAARADLARARAAIPDNTPPTQPFMSAIAVEAGLQHLVARDPVVAESLFRAAQTIRAGGYPASDPRLVRITGLVGVALAAAGRYRDAAPLISTASHVLDSAYTRTHSFSLEMSGALAELDSAQSGRDTPAQATVRFANYMKGQP